MNSLPIDLIQYCIFDKLDFKTQLRFRQICKRLNRVDIHNMCYNIDDEYLDKLSDEILINYPKVKYLDASYNSKITNVNHMTKLQILDIHGMCGIDNNGIKHLNLIELGAFNNRKITNINHMTKLQILDASYDCGLDNNSIKDLNLINLDVWNNPKITNVNHMTNLQILNASGYECGLDDNGIKDLNLIKLYNSRNPKITKKMNY